MSLSYKTQKQIAGLDKAYLAKDDIEIGFGTIIRVWLFGFMH